MNDTHLRQLGKTGFVQEFIDSLHGFVHLAAQKIDFVGQDFL